MNTVQCCDWRDLLSALSDDSADLILTDMPYGTTACSWDTVIDLDAWWVEAHRVAKPRAAIVCTGSQPFTSRLVMSNVKRFRYEWVWEKTNAVDFAMATKRPRKLHENILVFFDKSSAYYPQMQGGKPYVDKPRSRSNRVHNSTMPNLGIVNNGTRFPSSVQLFANPNNEGLHPTQKPIPLFEYLIRTYTRPGDLVVDPFVGSGTTALAARNTGRRFICGDFTQEYVDIAQERLAQPYTPDMFDTLPAPDNGTQPRQMELPE
jgi:site-specific DNA-methyltransferase (adenine-specific)